MFTGCLAYASDVVLLNPTADSLENMLKIYEKYSVDLKIKFNTSKSLPTNIRQTKLLVLPILIFSHTVSNWNQLPRDTLSAKSLAIFKNWVATFQHEMPY